MFRSVLATTALALSLPLAAPLAAQAVNPVTFEAGNYGAMVEGAVTGGDYVDYTLGAQGGQEMFVELTVTSSTGNGTVYFNVLPPDSTGEALFVGSMDADGTSALVPLPVDGTYTIRVYQMGNDGDTGVTSDYMLDLSIQ